MRYITLQVRVNGIKPDALRVRKNEQHSSGLELIMEDSILGSFPLDDTFEITLRDPAVPEMGWRRVSVSELLRALSLALK